MNFSNNVFMLISFYNVYEYSFSSCFIAMFTFAWQEFHYRCLVSSLQERVTYEWDEVYASMYDSYTGVWSIYLEQLSACSMHT